MKLTQVIMKMLHMNCQKDADATGVAVALW